MGSRWMEVEVKAGRRASGASSSVNIHGHVDGGGGHKRVVSAAVEVRVGLVLLRLLALQLGRHPLAQRAHRQWCLLAGRARDAAS